MFWGPYKQELISSTGPYGVKRILKKFLYSREEQTIGLEPNFHESGTFGGFGKRGQSFIQYPAGF